DLHLSLPPPAPQGTSILSTHTIRHQGMLGPVDGRIQVIDSHTGGEPTRVVMTDVPDLGGGSVARQLQRLRAEHACLRRSVVDEPRGSDVLVGALLCPSEDPAALTGV